MGKTFRKNNGTSISESWSENKHRDFARNRKRTTQHSIRNKNKKDLTNDNFIMEKMDCSKKSLINNFKCNGYGGKTLNINNKKLFISNEVIDNEKYLNNGYFTDSLEWTDGLPKNWDSSKGDLKDRLDNIINELPDNNESSNYLKACKKQIERRGKVEIFKGHRE